MTRIEVIDEMERLITAVPGKSVTGLSARSGLSASRVTELLVKLEKTGRVEIRNELDPEHGTMAWRSYPVIQ